MFIWFLLAAVLSTLLTGPLLFFLRSIKARQVEREEGPSSHKAKSGTPTMGGVVFVLIVAVFSLLFLNSYLFPVVLLTLGFALIGFLDDFFKIQKKQNLGLTFWQKIILQTLIASLFAITRWNVSLLNFIFWVFIIVGAANATNLTDGLDGLLSGTAILAFLSFTVVAFKAGLYSSATFPLVFAGAITGFLVYNFPKAKLFMGDVGSLSIGAALAGFAILIGKEWLLALIGFIFVIEALSVIIQVAFFKLFKRRIFKMSPLHHHFELSGFREFQVVIGFWVFQLILSILGAII